MKVYKLTTVLLGALMFTASADVTWAGPKKLPRLKATKPPRVALAQVKVSPTPAVVPNVAPAVERAVTAQVAHKAPRKWLDIIEPWILEHKRWPVQGVKEENLLYQAAFKTIKKHPNDPISIRLKKLKKKYGPNVASHKTPQEWLAIVEHWVLKHQRWPSGATRKERLIYAGASSAMRRNPNDPASKRLTELKEQYLPAVSKTPQKWLEIIEPWVLEHKRWPQSIQEESSLYDAARFVIKKYPDDPASVRLKELKEKYQ